MMYLVSRLNGELGRPRNPIKIIGVKDLPAFCPPWLDCFSVACRCGATAQRKELVEEKADPEPVMGHEWHGRGKERGMRAIGHWIVSSCGMLMV